MGDANYCAACPEELPEVDSEENYPDIVEVYLGDRVLEGDEINAVKGVPEDELFGTNPPDGSVEKRGTEAKDRTVLPSKSREVIKQLLRNRDNPSALKTALITLKKLLRMLMMNLLK